MSNHRDRANESYDRVTVATVEKLIKPYKQEFGDEWQRVFSATIWCAIPST
jgi:hypothetical protein